MPIPHEALTLLERKRIDADLEREDLHRKSGVPVRTIRELEARRVRSPRLATLSPLAKALKCNASDLAADFRANQQATETPVDATDVPTAEAA